MNQLLILGIVAFVNLWIWKVFSTNLFLGLLVLGTTIFIYLSFKTQSKSILYLSIYLFIILLFFQWSTTEKISLTYVDNDQQRVQHMRLREYPLLPLPLAWWFEGRNETIAAFRIQNNLGELLDPNLYFFANHPRERVGIIEFEKFPYILLPFLLLGMLISFKEKRWFLLLSSVPPLILISLIGHKNPLGLFSLFPFLAITTVYGMDYFLGVLPARYKTKIIWGGVVAFVLVFIQTVAYVRY